MKPDRRLIFLMTVGYRRLQRGLEQEMLAQDGLTSAQSGVLFFLGQNDGALIGDVASALDGAGEDAFGRLRVVPALHDAKRLLDGWLDDLAHRRALHSGGISASPSTTCTPLRMPFV